MKNTIYKGDLCSVFLAKCHSGDQVKKTETGRACSTNTASRGPCRVLVGKPEGRRPLGKPKHRWEDNIKWISEKWSRKTWTGSIWFRIGTVCSLV